MTDSIVPDDKDWTWVLERACPECGVDASGIEATSVAGMIRSNADEWAELLVAPAADLRRRPVPDRWSTLEYSAHVRDVFVLYRYRLGLMVDHEDPLFPNWDQDETAVAERYNELDPVVVSAELVGAGRQLADAFDTMIGDQWSRTGRRSDGASFTIDSFARYLIHDPVHHLWDVQRSV